MRFFVVALALALSAAPALAEPPAATTGAMLRDANHVRLGRVDQVRPDGSVSLIVGSKFVVVPASTLSVVDGKLTTSLTKKEIGDIK
ncbi:hypothetical protein [Sphingomonas sanxanigenens]|uniref:PRC-barrel domain-containing protein n=1 Tax=Sphingomonas sanxanigenens DSM 19645 = NX02 TaxID=1123269 RepID=W0A5Z4_9SPHN|nr:hypothetical protein [Sphingomonas sanxanigenens]AHE51897.1 hypothetical protein NX02_00650 [Sphingomonas sanxanigenens DSM 19645 = NX02]